VACWRVAEKCAADNGILCLQRACRSGSAPDDAGRQAELGRCALPERATALTITAPTAWCAHKIGSAPVPAWTCAPQPLHANKRACAPAGTHSGHVLQLCVQACGRVKVRRHLRRRAEERWPRRRDHCHRQGGPHWQGQVGHAARMCCGARGLACGQSGCCRGRWCRTWIGWGTVHGMVREERGGATQCLLHTCAQAKVMHLNSPLPCIQVESLSEAQRPRCSKQSGWSCYLLVAGSMGVQACARKPLHGRLFSCSTGRQAVYLVVVSPTR